MASITKRSAHDKTVYQVRIRRKGLPTIAATLARLTAARLYAAEQDATAMARWHLDVPEEHTVAELID